MNSTPGPTAQTIAGMERMYIAAVYVCDARIRATRIVPRPCVCIHLRVYIADVSCFQSRPDYVVYMIYVCVLRTVPILSETVLWSEYQPPVP